MGRGGTDLVASAVPPTSALGGRCSDPAPPHLRPLHPAHRKAEDCVIQHSSSRLSLNKDIIARWPTRFGFAATLLVIITLVLLVWNLIDPSWEAAFVLLVYALAWITRSDITAALSALRATYRARAIELDEDQTAEAWTTTNHSVSEIRWASITDPECRDIASTFWRSRCASGFTKRLAMFDRLLEDTATINIRVEPFFEETRLLRLYKALLVPEELSCRNTVALHLQKEKIFPDDMAQCVVALPLRGGGYSERISDHRLSPGQNIWGEVYHFARDVTHYPAESLDQLASVAKTLGKVQQSLQSLCADSIAPLVTGNAARKDVPFDRWPEIKEAVLKDSLLHPYVRLLRPYVPAIDKWIESVRVFTESTERHGEFILLHDVHPHNVFFRGGECVLIYDYQWVGNWCHGDVVCFAAHRFIRDLVAKHSGESPATTFISRAMRTFLDSYRQECDLKLPDDLELNMCPYIQRANVGKLISICWTGLYGHDKWSRGDTRMLGECRKFIKYMKEAESCSVKS